MNTKVGRWFSLEEAMVTNYPEFQDTPNHIIRKNIDWIAQNALDIARDVAGSIRVTSWYRSVDLNSSKGVMGSATSQHLHGLAIDCIPLEATDLELVLAIVAGRLPFHQIIFYPLEKLNRIHLGADIYAVESDSPVATRPYKIQVCTGPKSYVDYSQWAQMNFI